MLTQLRVEQNDSLLISCAVDTFSVAQPRRIPYEVKPLHPQFHLLGLKRSVDEMRILPVFDHRVVLSHHVSQLSLVATHQYPNVP